MSAPTVPPSLPRLHRQSAESGPGFHKPQDQVQINNNLQFKGKAMGYIYTGKMKNITGEN